MSTLFVLTIKPVKITLNYGGSMSVKIKEVPNKHVGGKAEVTIGLGTVELSLNKEGTAVVFSHLRHPQPVGANTTDTHYSVEDDQVFLRIKSLEGLDSLIEVLYNARSRMLK